MHVDFLGASKCFFCVSVLFGLRPGERVANFKWLCIKTFDSRNAAVNRTFAAIN